jgi:hypothetical protein
MLWRAAIAHGGRSKSRPIEALEEPGRARGAGAFCLELDPQLSIVGDDEEARRRADTGGGSRLIDQAQDRLIGRPPSRVADDEPGRDPLAAEAGFWWAIEHELDTGRRGDDGPQPADQGGLRGRAASAGERVEQVRPVDDQSIGAGQRIAWLGHEGIVRWRAP